MTLGTLVKSVLVLLTAISYLPQFETIHTRGDARGISDMYLLLNALVASEQFAFLLFCGCLLRRRSANGGTASTLSVPAAPDMLDLVQMGVYWFFSSLYLLICTTYSPTWTKYAFVLLCILVNALLLAPSVMENLHRANDRMPPERVLKLHVEYLSPICTAVQIIAFVPQQNALGRALLGLVVPALSEQTLSLQFILFVALAVSWTFRLRPATAVPESDGSVAKWSTWYSTVGWAAANHAIFAVGQGLLYWALSTHT